MNQAKKNNYPIKNKKFQTSITGRKINRKMHERLDEIMLDIGGVCDVYRKPSSILYNKKGSRQDL
ncbi:hypothetical protein BDD26_0668 [Xenorhabdus cabanillasii]|uniref:Uncharacterized protein n=1 Tax=Xenorhabdus cabanillasii TaxID=351673 RepID=A0A3D9UA44_9GAMM|nr:hypothetical protein [Xenorhabdus cabanillasii]REF26087.1 hypothetical protein BDD26_0668 [Xenorhabdus cabanillasii]